MMVKPILVSLLLMIASALSIKIITFPARAVSNGFSSIGSLFNTYDENERLKERIDSYGELSIQNSNLKKENEALKKELELNATLGNYEKVSATVISRSPDMWQDLLIVDRGLKRRHQAEHGGYGTKRLNWTCH
jgi:cell shape-determining protein MreC